MDRGREGTERVGWLCNRLVGRFEFTCADPSASHEALLAPAPCSNCEGHSITEPFSPARAGSRYLLGGRTFARRFGSRCRRSRIWGLADHHDVRDIRRHRAADDPVDRVGFDRILVKDRVDLGSGSRPAITKHALCLDNPFLIPGAGPEPLTVAATGVEDPRLDLPGLRDPSR